ncbi:MAG TPA: DUF2059 domain-containing protein [Xanthobacteraceae bacterium]|jgi:hypothetical protein|nr:DUF2059 domain-containing protein [Xanthobacteraceae bacterium]
MNRLNFARAWKFAAAAFVFGCFISASSSEVLAQAKTPPTAAQMKLARDILQSSGEAKALEPLIPSVMQQAFTNFVQQNPDLQKPLVETMTALQPEFMKLQPEVTDIMTTSMASHFTEAELKEILAFYNTTTGKKYVAEMPKVIQESLAAAREWASKLSDRIVARVREEMKKKGHAI